jgi:hypothetical protein
VDNNNSNHQEVNSNHQVVNNNKPQVDNNNKRVANNKLKVVNNKALVVNNKALVVNNKKVDKQLEDNKHHKNKLTFRYRVTTSSPETLEEDLLTQSTRELSQLDSQLTLMTSS